MSYNRRNDNFSVTSGKDGFRTFKGDHDDRWQNSSGGTFRGRGNSSRGNHRSRRGYRNFNDRSARYRHPGNNDLDEEGDVSMSGDSSTRHQSRFDPYRNSRNQRGNTRGKGGRSRGRGSVRPITAHRNRTGNWFKVMVPFGALMSKDELLNLIRSNLDVPFEPVQYSTDEKRAYFYIQGNVLADSLRSISRRITKPDNHKLVLHIQGSDPPAGSNIDENVTEKLMYRMSERYDPSTQLLTLSALFSDESLVKDNIFLHLNRKDPMTAVTKIISEHIPEMSGLDLSNNKLLSLGHMIDLVKATPNLTSLNLANNQIRTTDELDKLKGWSNITELVLEGNDLCNSTSSQSAYVSEVRKKFPKVSKLDGKDLPPPVTFDIDTNVSVPPSKGSYFGLNDAAKDYVIPFIKEFYTIYDSDRRRDLMAAYHEKAQFSVYYVRNSTIEKQVGFNNYADESRNLIKIGHYDPDKLFKKMKIGQLAVVSSLESLPKTTHDVESFKVDVSLATPKLLSFILHGVFKENDGRSDKPHVRTFSRTFITVPSGSGMVITNDILAISNASYEVTRKSFQKGAPTPSSSPVPPATVTSPSASGSASGTSAWMTEEQRLMVQRFMKDSNMNETYSQGCLQENGWDYQRAGQNFTELHSQGKIPPEAFVQP